MLCAIDTSGLRVSNAGISEYTRSLIRALNENITELQLAEVQYHPLFGRETGLRVIDTVLREAVWTNVNLPFIARSKKADIIHSPSFHFPLYSLTPAVITIHDLYAFREPDHLNSWHRNTTVFYVKQAVKLRKHIIVVSQFVKDELLYFFHDLKPELVHVVYSGIGLNRYRIQSEGRLEQLRLKFALKNRYILSVSTIEPRKNFRNLILAFFKIHKETDHDLVIVGKYGWKNKELTGLIDQYGLQDRVKFTGFVSDEELNLLYSYADCFVFPSLYEGFGFTVLEAMNCGCPVVTSNVSSIPEVAGDAALLVNPLDTEDIAQGILKVVNTVLLRAELIEKGYSRAKKFSWKSSALETFKIYQKVIE